MSETTATKRTHTPGPWEVEEELDGCWTVKEPVGQTDGFTGGYRWFNEADARLIAAAPELLTLVRSFVHSEGLVGRGFAQHLRIARELLERIDG